MELLQIKCPTCHSAVLQSHTTYATQCHGHRILYKCTNCPTYFSETKKTLMAGLKTPGLSTCVETLPRPISMRSHNKTASKHCIRE